jgi:hypothetical protein
MRRRRTLSAGLLKLLRVVRAERKELRRLSIRLRKNDRGERISLLGWRSWEARE